MEKLILEMYFVSKINPFDLEEIRVVTTIEQLTKDIEMLHRMMKMRGSEFFRLRISEGDKNVK